MTHRDYFRCSFEELRLGECITEESFNARYRPQMAEGLRPRDSSMEGRAVQGEAQGVTGQGSRVSERHG